MKWVKRLIISVLIIFFFYILLYKPDGINLEGNWEAKEIVLDNKKIYPDLLATIIDFPPIYCRLETRKPKNIRNLPHLTRFIKFTSLIAD